MLQRLERAFRDFFYLNTLVVHIKIDPGKSATGSQDNKSKNNYFESHAPDQLT